MKNSGRSKLLPYDDKNRAPKRCNTSFGIEDEPCLSEEVRVNSEELRCKRLWRLEYIKMRRMSCFEEDDLRNVRYSSLDDERGNEVKEDVRTWWQLSF